MVESIVGERTFGNKYLLDWLSMGCSIIITSLRIAAVNSCEDSSPDLSVSSTCPQIHEVKFIHYRQSCSLRRIRLATLKSLWRRMERSWSSVKSSDSFFRRGSSGFLHGNVANLNHLYRLHNSTMPLKIIETQTFAHYCTSRCKTIIAEIVNQQKSMLVNVKLQHQLFLL